MQAGESFNIKFEAYWTDADHTPHDYSIVAQAENAPVTLTANDHSHQYRDFENFTIDAST